MLGTITDSDVDTLLDLHAKLSTVVRYYDRMLEERLSKAYGQHSLGGYNLPAPRQSVGPYPSLQSSAQSHSGPAETFYSGEAQPDYSRPTQPQQYQPTHQTPQQQFATYDKRASISGPSSVQYPPQQQLQRTDSWRNSVAPGQTPQFAQQNYGPAEGAPSQVGLGPQGPAQQGRLATQGPPESMGTTPTTDPNASFYFNQPQTQAQQTPSAPPSEPVNSPYPTLRQTAPYQPSLPQTPATAPAQPAQPMQPQQQPPPQQPQAPYWAHPAAAHQPVPVPAQAPPQQVQPPQAWPQAPNTAYDSYNQEAFPSAPHHAPKQPVVEEALIEL